MSKTNFVRKILSKSFLVILLAFQFIFIFNINFPSIVQAQDATCGGGLTDQFVNWQQCLFNPKGTSNTVGKVSVVPSFNFINSGYTKFYNDVCSRITATNIQGCLSGEVNEYALNLTIAKLILDIVTLILFIMVAIFLFLIFKGVYIWVTAGDSEENVTKAKKTFSAAGIGLLTVALGFIVIGILGTLLGLGNFWEIKLFG
ncbi:MAG: hypothetical protein WCK31_02430 [bacterium]